MVLKFRLTERERGTVELLLEGLTTKEIAQRMNISPNTVKAFLRTVMLKLEVSNRSGILAKVLGTLPCILCATLTDILPDPGVWAGI
jgi:DNA-binding CsgD family transcriptional regulator